MIVWCICTLIAKILIFFLELAYHHELVQWGTGILSQFNGHPKLELVVVMVIMPTILNSLMFYIQDSFLKGDKHLDSRRAE